MASDRNYQPERRPSNIPFYRNDEGEFYEPIGYDNCGIATQEVNCLIGCKLRERTPGINLAQ